VLRDGQGKEIALEAKSVQKLQPSRTSLMPDGQLAGPTAQEAADLLEYLATRQQRIDNWFSLNASLQGTYPPAPDFATLSPSRLKRPKPCHVEFTPVCCSASPSSVSCCR
jgi:hypothetical protein